MVLAGLLCSAASCLRPYGKVQEAVNPAVPGSQFRTLTVIAAGDEDADIQVAVRVRRSLEQAGVAVVPSPGRWPTELAALEGVCGVNEVPESTAVQRAAARVDGVLFVSWDRLLLRDCPTQRTAYEIKGSWSGVDYMVRRLVKYLRTGDK